MRLEVDLTPLNKDLLKLEKQSVVVGVDNTTKAANADYSKPPTTLSTLSGSTARNFVKRKGRQKNITLRKLAFILDAKKGIFSDVLINAENKELVAMGQLFAKFNKSAGDIRRLQNIGQALVRNPILRKDYNPNKPSTIKRKRFNHYGLNTGTFFNNIKAKYFKR